MVSSGGIHKGLLSGRLPVPLIPGKNNETANWGDCASNSLFSFQMLGYCLPHWAWASVGCIMMTATLRAIAMAKLTPNREIHISTLLRGVIARTHVRADLFPGPRTESRPSRAL